ncbi:MAG: signal peptidase II [Gammaproteobacteria bacterium RIFCSPHIGHO2_12_FULL_37_14]|nr:MAG: signal peptidase II [Gammaproteobacteria bacterium RIFCSPHIGHO2_12_FULL_37_14]
MLKKIFSSGLRWIWVAILVLAIDRFAKMWAIHYLVMGEPFRILPIFNLTLAFNTGAAFSFLHSASGWQNIFLGSLAILVSVIILIWLGKLTARDSWLSIALSLVLGGAIGNVWDRILYGHVVDFFDFHLGGWHFAIFNTADSAICIGAFMMLLHWLIYPNS